LYAPCLKLHLPNFLSRCTILFFSFHAPAFHVTCTVSLHDALPISGPVAGFLFAGLIVALAPLLGADLQYRGPWEDSKFTFDWYLDRKSTRLNSSHVKISYAVFCLKKKNKKY